ncbi:MULTISPECIES: sterol desaturase family protein [Pseudomonas]|uniref:sterol desaturase family protein n=1 Tax=Pseudomonas TaxID=286 RepID=UPI0008773E14|nr:MULTISPECIES: sterol desaturase family protein [Pseudomonas]TFA82927.1 sterol desaturase/sphingolipid hydroxylase (fatty acid hydroxylase superfamily) [Pseudomonas sp. LAIL14HWK12:I2]SCZ36294.1 Sterol desaturase/sphingolipid hydroxylase, fatty acid hydroxylase superfamily [Pseudomonas sp. NFIX46]SDB41613.1 Sterol desaturase/sphingolipid hydroxylase, fatty acid hydroxylase superfamily [Pseudomonas putida]SFQ89751.1 Sterol desaturase/sphingolipid hydroxylase, fatty acid hydroxylase superfamily
MNFILYAVPFFFVLIAAELIADRWRGVSNYRLADAVNSISTGVLSTTTGLLTKGVGLVTYAFALEHLALVRLPADSVWVWVFAFVFYDFCYYWLHRMGHERNILWAAHSVHHQSEDYNLSTALRQTSTGFLLSWIFYLPMAVLGVPLLVFVSVAALNLLYQFWVHTRHIPKLGWFEWCFVTPSNHRAHHAQNALYMDRNYGGVFIIWDRLFGSFQEEDDNEPVIFGVTTPLGSWNPLWANLQFYAQLWDDARRAERTWDKIRIWFMRTGWRPADVAAKYPMNKPDLSQFRKFEVPLDSRQQWYVGLQFGVYVALGSYLMNLEHSLPTGALLLGWGAVAFGLFVLGAALENRPWAAKLEVLRLALNLPLVWLAPLVGLWPASPGIWVGLLSYSLLSGIGLYGCRQRLTRLAS